MVINTNVAATQAGNNLAASTVALQSSLARLSSGLKITSPQDDPAGLAVSSGLDAESSQITAISNGISSALSFAQTQDGYLSGVSTALQRMADLATSAQSATASTTNQSQYQSEFNQLQNYVANVFTKQFNGVSLFSTTNLTIVTSPDSSSNSFQMTGISLGGGTVNVAATGAGVVLYTSGSTAAQNASQAATALADIQSALAEVANDRASVGAYMTRLTYTQNQLSVLNQNVQAASSQIKDVDMASESSNFARDSILVQSGTAMLAQANALPQSVLKLLG